METNMSTKLIAALRKLVTWRYFPVLVLISVNVVIGSRIVQDYGISWDEPSRYQVAEKSLASYMGEAKDRKGSFYLALSRVGSAIFHRINHSWSVMDAWHYTNFFFYYQIAAFFFFMICLRLANKWVATAATLLFITQPLLWGHAFVNPKDIPFTAFFTASVALGLWMVERFPQKTYEEIDNPFFKHIRETGLIKRLAFDWEKLGEKKQALLKKTFGISLGLLAIILLATPLLHALIRAVIQQAYYARAGTFLSDTFRSYAQNTSAYPVDKYVEKTFTLYGRGLLFYAILTLLLNVLLTIPFLPTTLSWFWQHQLASGMRVFWLSFKRGSVWAMSLFMGLANSIRVIGLAAGLLVGVYFLINKGRKAFPVLLACFMIASLVTYLCWPGMWGSTPDLNRIYTKTTSFSWQSSVLFNGIDYQASTLPRSYLPTLLALQFTEPALLLFLIGLGSVIYRSLKNKKIPTLPLVASIWLFVPIAGVLIVQPTIYDNFRHVLFIVPAIFLFACLGMQVIFEKVKAKYVTWIILAALIIPNLYWDINLHPYQYLYYNEFIGGEAGAFRRFEMDYWTTSYRDATLYLNQVAPPNARIYVWGPLRVVRYYSRHDFIFLKPQESLEGKVFDYAILSTRHDKDLKVYPHANILYRVERDGAVFAVVKQLSQTDNEAINP
jgi:hypothetical protein